MDGHTIITELTDDGEPLNPPGIKTKVTNQLGYLVRENVPITYKFWKRNTRADLEEDIVPNTEKELLWAQVKAHFSFPDNEMEAKAKKWAMRKMAIQFQSFKQKLNDQYVKTGRTPDFNKVYQNQKQFWEEFVAYKTSKVARDRSVQNAENASKKTTFHHLGPGGYAKAIPKWIKMEEDLRAKGIVPANHTWPLRARWFFYAHGGSLDPEDGSFRTSDSIRAAVERLEVAIKMVEEGTFRPNREKDELSFALGNPEHCGRTRGMGVVPWNRGFLADLDTYRSRCRSKQMTADKFRFLEERIASLEARQRSPQQAVSAGVQVDMSPVPQEEPAQLENVQVQDSPVPDQEPVVQVEMSPVRHDLDISPASQHISSVASTEVQDQQAERYPVDDITEPTECELLYLRGKKLKVCAYGQAEVPVEGGTIHSVPIPSGYARVLVDKVVEGWEDLDIPIPGGEGEQELKDVVHQWICWEKKHIKLVKKATTGSTQSSRAKSLTPPPTDNAPTPPSPVEPTPPPKKRKPQPPPPKKYITSKTLQQATSRPQKKKEKPPPPKLAYEKTPEETDEAVRKEVHDFFKRTPPPPKEPIDPKVQEFFIKQARPAQKERESDYERSIRKSYQKPQNRVSASRGIPQLGQQPNQKVEPLKVISDKEVMFAKMLAQTDLTKEQMTGKGPRVPKRNGKKRFKLGEPLIWPELLPHLPTRMFELHQWYMEQSKDGLVMFAARASMELYRPPADIWIEFLNLSFLYHRDALDKSLLSAWVL